MDVLIKITYKINFIYESSTIKALNDKLEKRNNQGINLGCNNCNPSEFRLIG